MKHDDDEWFPREVRIPKGTHLSDSRDTPGAERNLLREDGTNRLLGPTESREVKSDVFASSSPTPDAGSPDYGHDMRGQALGQDKLSPSQQAVADALFELLAEAIREFVIPVAREHIFPWAVQKVGELVQRMRVTSIKVYERAAKTSITIRPPKDPAQDANGSDAAATQAQVRMSQAELIKGLNDVLQAERFLAERKRLLADALREGNDLPAELIRVIEQVGGDTPTLDEGTLVVIADFSSRTEAGGAMFAISASEDVVFELNELPAAVENGS
ncbi:hypothetical protein [Cryobacterium sp. TMT4-31]|uniref:hypothetical protein n=1 Tax=Cryobacterium sp. TMT4-31 TaxID=1259259 RepID=UPI00106D6F0B|nr:hypothetical protein [Cryobacterium sp. TMT4-31]TFC87440.1 hypothetical protein E3T19_12455 [Cryobacterium sp. TMT4-31]